MKKVKLLLTMAVIVFSTMICCSMSAFALTEGDWEFKLLDNEVTITGYLGDDTEVVIPETLYGCPVTQMKKYIFGKNVKSISFPSGIKEILPVISGSGNALEEVIIPEGVEKIGFEAFYGCGELESVHLPSTITEIGLGAFGKCEKLSEINFPQSLEKIGLESFYSCNLKSVVIPANVAEIGGGAFSRNKNLESIKIDASIKELPCGRLLNGFFYDCTSLKEVILPATLEEIGGYAFQNCKSLESIILPTSLKEIGANAFYGCESLKEVVVPYGVKEIGPGAFENNKNLESVYVPDSVTSLGNGVTENSDNCIIYCSADSKAASLCKEKDISYLTDNSVNSRITVIYNGKRISFHSYGQNPELLEGRTLVPLRSIFEAMGADVEWDDATSSAIAKRDGVEMKIQIGANEMYKNGKAIPVDVPAMLLNSRTMVPVRVIAEAFGADVQWNESGRTVLITE